MTLIAKQTTEISEKFKDNLSPVTKIGLIIGTGALILGGILIFLKTKKNHPDTVKIQSLRKQIKLSFQAAQPSLCPLTQ